MDQEYRQFKNPPIKEAIFTISFTEPLSPELLNAFKSSEYVTKSFPHSQKTFIVETKVKVEGPQSISTSHKEDGFILKNDETSNKLITVRPTHLSYHNFNQYAGWDVMVTELKDVWEALCKTTGPKTLSQVSVRYLNHIYIPLPLENGFGEYILLMPSLPPGLTKKLDNFFLQIVIPDEENYLQGIITETIIENKATKQAINFLIDLTVSKKLNQTCDNLAIWELFKHIRRYKNKLFLSCITEKTQQLFEK